MARARIALLHGFTGSAQSWRYVVDALASNYDFVVPDLFGHAQMLSTQLIKTFDDEVQRLASLVDAELRDIWLCGYSMGGRLALRLLLAHPNKFRGAILISAHPGLQSAQARAARQVEDQAWSQLLRNLGLSAFIKKWEERPLWNTQRQANAAALQEQHDLRLRHDPNSLASALEVLGLGAMPDTWNELKKIDHPVFWLTGSLDQKFSEIARSACTENQKFKHQELLNVGHNPILENPVLLVETIKACIERSQSDEHGS